MRKIDKQKNRKSLMTIFIIGMILILSLFYIVNRQMKDTKIKANSVNMSSKTKKERAVLVSAITVQKGFFQDIISNLSGKIDVAKAKLSFEINGVVNIIAKEKGEKASQGDILAELDKTDLLLKIKYKQNSLKSAEIELKKTQNILVNIQEKAKSGMITESKISEYKMDVSLKETKVVAAKLELEAAEINLRKAELRAPFDGIILERKIEKGESISSNTESFVFLDGNDIFADIEINEKNLPYVNPGQRILLQTDVYENEIIEGIIQTIVPALKTKARVLSARAKLNSLKHTFVAGMYLTCSIISYEEKNVISIPVKALYKDKNINFVYKINKDNKTAHKQIVTIGYVSKDKVIIKEGLKESDQVIIRATDILQEGIKVRIEE